MGKDPSDIRAELEETRGRVGDEVDALSYKTDVSARVGDYVEEKKQAVKDKVTGAHDTVTGTASRAVPNGEQVSRFKDTAERNPIGLAVGAAAVGFVAGLLIPSTRVENERMGEVSDRFIDAAKETAGDAVERGKQVAQEAAETARKAAATRARNWQRIYETVPRSQPAAARTKRRRRPESHRRHQGNPASLCLIRQPSLLPHIAGGSGGGRRQAALRHAAVALCLLTLEPGCCEPSGWPAAFALCAVSRARTQAQTAEPVPDPNALAPSLRGRARGRGAARPSLAGSARGTSVPVCRHFETVILLPCSRITSG